MFLVSLNQIPAEVPGLGRQLSQSQPLVSLLQLIWCRCGLVELKQKLIMKVMMIMMIMIIMMMVMNIDTGGLCYISKSKDFRTLTDFFVTCRLWIWITINYLFFTWSTALSTLSLVSSGPVITGADPGTAPAMVNISTSEIY